MERNTENNFEGEEDGLKNPFMNLPFDNECCILKKCCKAFKKKGKYCKKCPKS